ncbi:class I SAM-dependent rRNA methyltransferase [soil metagenome]
MSSFPKIILHPAKERSIQNKHPWLFSGAIKKTEGNPKEGDVVEVFSAAGLFLATGHYHAGSITVRIFSFEQVDPGYEFWKSKLQSAFEYRRNLNFRDNPATNCYRLIHAEGDGMPGLIIDIYNSVAVIQTHTLGMHAIKNHLVQALRELYGNKLSTIYDKSGDTMSRHAQARSSAGEQQQLQISNELLFGNKTEEDVLENGIMFHVNFSEGQKTGFFLDQRENRKLLGAYTTGKKVLNTFAYSGGFSLYALKNDAALVHSVDSSRKAAEWAEKNVLMNFKNAPHQFYAEDVFDFMKKSEETYDVIILDPPAFAKHLSAVKQATMGYRNLNTEAIRRIAKGGILFTFSCSQVIDKELFRKIIFTAAAQARRNVRILHQLSQPPDHPISIYHPEGEYLKGLVLYVE